MWQDEQKRKKLEEYGQQLNDTYENIYDTNADKDNKIVDRRLGVIANEISTLVEKEMKVQTTRAKEAEIPERKTGESERRREERRKKERRAG